MEDYKALIGKHPLFINLTADELAEFVDLFILKSYHQGEIIVREGDIVDAIYFIAAGKAEVRKEQQPLATLAKGETIGLNDTGFFSTTGMRVATVVALSDVDTLRLGLTQFRNFLAAHPQMNQDILDKSKMILQMQFIKQVTPFSSLSPEKMHEFAKKITELSIPAGFVLLKQGEIGDACYLIKDGSIAISVQDANGNNKILATLGTSQLIGETALLLDAPRNATATAAVDTTLLVISKPLFLEIMEKETKTAKAVISLHRKRSRPIRATGIEIFQQKNSEQEDIITLRNSEKNAYFRLSSQGWFIWQLLDGTRNLTHILRDFYKEFNILDARLVLDFIIDLLDAGFVQLEMKQNNIAATRLPWWVWLFSNLRKMMEFQHPFVHADCWIERTYEHFVWVFYTRIAQWLLLIIAVAGFWVFLASFNHSVHLLNTSPHKWLLLFLAAYSCLFTFAFHELAHAYTAKANGRRVGAFGIGWLWLGPIVFCDTSDMWLCQNKAARIAVDLAGVYVNIIIGSIAALGLLFAEQPGLIIYLWLLAFLNYMTAFANLSPLLELDGYYALMDILNKPNLRESAIIMMSTLLKERFAFFWKTCIDYWQEAIYWLVCICYLVVEIMLPFLLLNYVFYGFLGSMYLPLSILSSILVAVFSAVSFFAEIRRKQLTKTQ